MVAEIPGNIEGEQRKYSTEIENILGRLEEDPGTGFDCIHGDGPAVGVFEVPEGCVVFPGIETQTLCPQHRLTDGSFKGMHMVVDLSIDGEWSAYNNERPDFYMRLDPASHEVKMTKFSTQPSEM